MRHATRGGRNVAQHKLADGLAVAGKLAFPLQNVDFHARLIVSGSGENLRLVARDRGVAFNQLGEHTAEGFNAKRERRHIQQQHVFHLAFENAGLDGGPHRDHFIRIHALIGSFVDQRARRFHHARHPGHAPHQH